MELIHNRWKETLSAGMENLASYTFTAYICIQKDR